MLCVFRVDSSFALGNGHLQRCLTLSCALQEQGISSLFILQHLPGVAVNILRDKGLAFNVITTTQNPSEDAAATLSILQQQHQPIMGLVVDVYQLDARWHQCVKPHVPYLLVIDDLANRAYMADGLLDHTPGRDPDDYNNLLPPSADRFMGADFALLREEFFQKHYGAQQRRQAFIAGATESPNVLLSFGGTDPHNLSGQWLQQLQNCFWAKAWNMTLVLASNCQHLSQLQQQVLQMQQQGWQISLQVNLSNMAELLVQQDVCVGAAGVSALERALLGLPSLVMATADNQIWQAEQLAALGVIRYLGNWVRQPVEEHKWHLALRGLHELLMDKPAYQQQVEACFKLFARRQIKQLIAQMLAASPQPVYSALR
jgi:UDP-2,4-diacetamido-2,4,6-trideoxy-beta-L-altropyranose hydrolase